MKFLRFFQIKKLDRFILKTFVTNLMGTFCICLFIFILQLLWRWVDDFVEKGLDFGVLAQFFGLGSVTLVSQALPLAILLAALMTFGNFGEKLELLAMKAAGIPLLRIMAPMVIFCSLLGVVSFFFQNIISPAAQMKLYTVMYSIKQSSPESEIPEGVFYNKLDGYNIYVDKKDEKSGTLHNVMIYDVTQGFEKSNILVSDSARIANTDDEKHMILTMYSGEQFSNLTDQQFEKKNRPYRRETFREKTVMIEIEGGFEMKDASIMKGNAASKNIQELEIAIDSLGLANDSIGRYNYNSLKRTTYNAKVAFNEKDLERIENTAVQNINADSVFNVATKKSKLIWKRSTLNKVKQMKVDYEINDKILHSLDKDLNKHKITWWEKFTLSISCLIFFFIGAPLGAIVRKGGLGYPVLISVATFILYYIFNTSGYKMAREGEWNIWFGAWISTMVLAPLGIFFTYQANKDSTLFNSDAIGSFFRMLFGIAEKRNVTLKEVIIDTPDYNENYTLLNELNHDARRYRKSNRLKRLPSIRKVFFNEKDVTLDMFNAKLEKLVENLGNSKSRKTIILLNDFPILSPHATQSPFRRRWLNISSIVIFPIGILIYLRAVKFRFRLYKDLKTIEETSNKITSIFKKEKLINVI